MTRVDGQKESYMKKDVYQIITDRIIGLLEAGTVPWRRPWKGGEQAPRNFVSRKAYRGINLFLLHAAGFASPFWLTFRQVQSLDGRVKKGEKSFPVVFWKVFEEQEDNGESKRVPFLRYHSVFNVAQCEGITVPAPPEVNGAFQPIEKCDAVVAGMPCPPAILHGGARACYSPREDRVTMPEATMFESPAAYYTTLFHELTHATGHLSRLNRKEVTDPVQFGSNPYSREELVAEMGAAYLSGHCAILDTTIDQSASYIQNWLERLRDDRKLVIHAAAQAQKACDFILGEQLAEEETPIPVPGKEPHVMALNEAPLAYGQGQSKFWLASRRLKIEAVGDFCAGRVKPKIRLTGKWLEQAGFPPGEHVRVSLVAPGVMQLRSAATVRYEPF